MSFKVTDTPNILGKIEGINKSPEYLFICSHVDAIGGTGRYNFDSSSTYDASEIAMMLELARTLKAQKLRPEKTVIFAVWNSFEEGMIGSKHYVNNPLYPLNISEVIVLDHIGASKSSKIYLSSYGTLGEALMGKLSSYMPDKDLEKVITRDIDGNDNEAFLMKDVPAVLLQGDTVGTPIYNPVGNSGMPVSDSAEDISKEQLNIIGSSMVKYFQRDIYKDWVHELLKPWEEMLLSVLIVMMIFIYLLKLCYKLRPSSRLLGMKIYCNAAFKCFFV